MPEEISRSGIACNKVAKLFEFDLNSMGGRGFTNYNISHKYRFIVQNLENEIEDEKNQ